MAAKNFGNDLFLNVDIALRSIDRIYTAAFNPLGLAVVEAYILRTLHEEDGQHASALARAVGRAPTSFTPILDKIEAKGLIERRADRADRRAINVHLTQRGSDLREPLQAAFKKVDNLVAKQIPGEMRSTFQRLLLAFMNLTVGDADSNGGWLMESETISAQRQKQPETNHNQEPAKSGR